jgi:hypothetical protein
LTASLSEKERQALGKRIRSMLAEPEVQRRLREAERGYEEAVQRLRNPPRLPMFDEIEANLRKGPLDNRRAFQKEEGPLALFPTPPDATWNDVHIRFNDGHTVSITVKSARGVFHYTQMGMANKKNGKPTIQWELLRIFADAHGVLDWSSYKAHRRNQKRREILAANLRRFFRIEGDPFRLTTDRKGWEAKFDIFPDR